MLVFRLLDKSLLRDIIYDTIIKIRIFFSRKLLAAGFIVNVLLSNPLSGTEFGTKCQENLKINTSENGQFTHPLRYT